jgi:hypothetical protein
MLPPPTEGGAQLGSRHVQTHRSQTLRNERLGPDEGAASLHGGLGFLQPVFGAFLGRLHEFLHLWGRGSSEKQTGSTQLAGSNLLVLKEYCQVVLGPKRYLSLALRFGEGLLGSVCGYLLFLFCLF